MNIFICWEIDHADSLLASALLSGNVSELKMQTQDIQRAGDMINAWAMASGGSPVLDITIKGAVEIPADRMSELPDIRRRFEETCDCDLSIGVGLELHEAYQAMRVAKHRGGDQIVLYVPELEHELRDVEDDNIVDPLAGLGKAEDSPVEHSTSKESAVSKEAAPLEDLEGQDPKDVVMRALEDLRANAAEIEQLKHSNPEAFKAIVGAVNSMLLMAEGLTINTEK